MPDWKRIVREKLGSLPLTNGRRDEVIEELAQQLESAYEEALAQGINEQEALRRSLAQFKDWEKLRNEVFQSVEGTRLPVWEQNGIFAPRRLPVWITLVLALALFGTPTLRQALTIMPIPGGDLSAWNPRVFSEKALRRIEESGDKERYARTLAYVALHSPKEDDLRAMHAAEKAIALDPQLTWISAHVSHATYPGSKHDPHPWIERLKAWDPQNGFPYLLEASANVHYWEPPWTKYSATPGGLRPALAAEPRWRIPMEKAFATPRMDFYEAQEFALDRQVLQEQGFDRPDMLLAAGWSQPIPDLTSIILYEDIQLKDIGEPAEKAGRTEDALTAYWTVADFTDRLKATPMDLIQVCSNKLRRDAYKHILPLLRNQGRASEAAAIESALGALPSLDYTVKGPAGSFLEATSKRAGRVVATTAAFVTLSGIATALWLISVIALNWRANLSRALNRLSSILCFAPAALGLASFALLWAYYPYARPIGQFASVQDLAYGYAPFFISLYGSLEFGSFRDPWLTTMFWPLIWCVAIAVVGACLLWWVHHRSRPDDTRAA
jgi:hypothetical protein